jgi:hypothetical protein
VKVDAVHVAPAPQYERSKGLVAWLKIETCGLALDGFALRQTATGRPYLAFPKRRDSRGILHPQVWPMDPRERRSMVDQVLRIVAADFEDLAW